MNDGELKAKVHSSMFIQCKAKGYVAPVDVLLDSGIITKQQLEDWRLGRIPFLEAVCAVNLRKLSVMMHEMRVTAKKYNLSESFWYYKRWGVKKKHGQKKPVIPLRFSKSGDPNIEKWYSTHFLDRKRLAELKAAKMADDMPGDKIHEEENEEILE